MKIIQSGGAGAIVPRLHQRRLFLARCLGLSGSILIFPVSSEETSLVGQGSSKHSVFVEQALTMKKMAVKAGDQPYGAIVVNNGQVVGFGPSRVIIGQDPTAHAEMEAIRDAAKRMGTRDLSGCILYSTSRPCRMCETAAYWAKISAMYFGETPVQAGKPEYGC